MTHTVDRSSVDDVEAVDEFAGVAVRILAGHVESAKGPVEMLIIDGIERPTGN